MAASSSSQPPPATRPPIPIIRRDDGKAGEKGDYYCEVPGCGHSMLGTVRSTAYYHAEKEHQGLAHIVRQNKKPRLSRAEVNRRYRERQKVSCRESTLK